MRKLPELVRMASLLRGLPVLGCLADSPAAVAGVRYGDILLSVNGQPTPDWESYIRARNDDASHLDIVLFRDGAELSISVELPSDPRPEDPHQLIADLLATGIWPRSGDDQT